MCLEIEKLLPDKFIYCYKLANEKDTIEEIRIKVNCPIMFYGKKGEIFTGYNLYVSKEDMEEAIEYIFGYSVYAYENEIREGFVTVRGGHRVGIAGRIVFDDEKIKNITNISSVNIRVSHEVKGMADKIAPYIFEDYTKNTLVISKPMAGKTTLLRDLIRIGSNKYKKKISIIDERGEIAATYMGIANNDIGIRSDVLDNAPKDKGIMMAIRAMSPHIIAVDEIGQVKDIEAILEAFNCGVNVFATIHGNNLEDVNRKRELQMVMEGGYFERYIVIDKDINGARIIKLFDKNGSVIEY